MRILIVDDSRIARAVLRNVLAEIGLVDIAEAANGEEGFEAARRGNFDLVICDWNMPIMDGLTFVKQLKQSASKETPILVVSSESAVSRIMEVMQAGAQAYIKKPFTAQELRAKILEINKRLELARKSTTASYLSGSVAEIGLPELIQFVASSRLSGCLNVRTPEGTGVVAFWQGEICSARFGDLKDTQAFFAIAALTEGGFTFERLEQPAEKGMSKPTLPLLIEAMRRRDEVEAKAR